MALRREDVDLAADAIHVRRGWYAVEGKIATKSRKDRRVPIPVILRDYLDEHPGSRTFGPSLHLGVMSWVALRGVARPRRDSIGRCVSDPSPALQNKASRETLRRRVGRRCLRRRGKGVC